MSPPKVSHGQITRRQIENLFAHLESELGFLAKFNWACCQSCGWADLHKYCQDHEIEFDEKNIIFCHNPDCERAFGLNRDLQLKSKMIDTLWIAWSGDGHEIKRALESRGFQVEWDGTEETRMQIKV